MFTTINVTDVTDRACACRKSVLHLSVDKDHRTSNWVLILYHTCTTNEMNCRQELKIVYSGDLNFESDNQKQIWRSRYFSCLTFGTMVNISVLL